jgi:hypothetical protein
MLEYLFKITIIKINQNKYQSQILINITLKVFFLNNDWGKKKKRKGKTLCEYRLHHMTDPVCVFQIQFLIEELITSSHYNFSKESDLFPHVFYLSF